MTEVNQNFTMYAGDSKVLLYTIKGDSGETLDVTTLTSAQFVIKQYPDSSVKLLDKDFPDSGVGISNGPEGIISVSLVPADTKDLNPGEYYHELRIVLFGSTSTVAIGVLKIKPTTEI